MTIKTQLVEFLDKNLPTSKYSDGTESHCVIHRFANLFDVFEANNLIKSD